VIQQPAVNPIEGVSDPAKPNSLLIVDDDEMILSLLCDVLSREDRYRISTATVARKALELLRDEPFDLLITDYRMPEMTGLDLIREAKRLHPDLIAILITGFVWPDVASEATEAGAYDLMFKPLNIGEIRITIRNACERINLIRAIHRYQRELEQTTRKGSPTAHGTRPAESMTEIGLFPPHLSPVTRGSQKKEQILEQLERLGKLYQIGLLTKEEFIVSKSRLFDRS
jgi:YesN/AraC family two-component response regulator